MEDFKVYRTNWIPGLGHAFAIITFERDRPLYPSTERFFVVPTEPLHVEFQRWEYNGIGPQIQPDESLWKHQFEAIEGAIIDFLHLNRAKLDPFYYDIVTTVQWQEVPRDWLFHYNLRSSFPGNLAPVLSQIREQTECGALQDFLNQFQMKAMRDRSLSVKPRSNATGPVNVGLLAGIESR
jgi:hypothetical protein